MSPLERFHKIAQTPLNRWRDLFPGHRPVGIYNAYVPEEMFQAAGLAPVYVFHQSDDRGHARTHLPSFACWPGRSLVDQALSGELSGLAGMAFAQTCDMVQALTDIWRKAMPDVPVYHVGIPLHLATHAARPYLIAELNRLRQALGGFSDDALCEAIGIHNRTRELVAQLYDRSADLRPRDLCAVLRAALMTPKTQYNALLSKLLNRLETTEKGESVDSPIRNSETGSESPSLRIPKAEPRLILVGPHLADPVVYHVIDVAGARVADDLLDVGSRYFAAPVEIDDDPIAALADRTLATFPTPTKHHPDRRRDKYLVELVNRRQARGVIFARQKFCDPHGFDYAHLKPTLDQAGIPSLLLELEQASQTGQIQTRVEAFLEILR